MVDPLQETVIEAKDFGHDFSQNNFSVLLMVPVADGSHLCIVLRSDYDLILIYEVKTRKVVFHQLMKEAIVDSICSNSDCVFFGCRTIETNEILFYIKPCKDLTYKFVKEELDFQENLPLTAMAVTQEILIKSVGRFIAYKKLNNHGEGMKPCHLTQHVREIVISRNEKVFFVSSQCCTLIYVFAYGEGINELFEYDCCEDIKSCSPSTISLDMRVSCMCSVYNMLWVGTGSGHIFIYEVQQSLNKMVLLLTLHPYKSETRRFTLVHCPNRKDGVEYLIVSTGKELNENTFGDGCIFKFGEIPVDETASSSKLYHPCFDKKGKVILIWHVLLAHQYKNLQAQNLCK